MKKACSGYPFVAIREAVVRDKVWKKPAQMQVNVFHVGETPVMEQHHQGDHLAGVHSGLSLGLVPDDIPPDCFVKTLQRILKSQFGVSGLRS